MDPGWEPLLCKAHKTSIFPCVVVHLKHFHLFSSEFSHPSLTFLSLGWWNISRRNSIPELHTHNKVIVYSGTTCNTAWAQLQRGHPSPWQHPPKCPVLGRVVMSTWGLNWSCRDEERKVTRVPGRLVWGRLTEQSSFCHHDVPNLYDSVSVDVQMFNSAVELQKTTKDCLWGTEMKFKYLFPQKSCDSYSHWCKHKHKDTVWLQKTNIAHKSYGQLLWRLQAAYLVILQFL